MASEARSEGAKSMQKKWVSFLGLTLFRAMFTFCRLLNFRLQVLACTKYYFVLPICL